ncbi:hypothetical protein AB3X94_35375, partial [Paraburkholderia sp. BR10923]|uniref:hypothetical protein n=1 Tax=Paraburkholderia sp. BR10923 TaxID=3236992 RepID=UPI0034CDC6E0
DPQKAAAFLRPCTCRIAQPLRGFRFDTMNGVVAENELFRPDYVVRPEQFVLPSTVVTGIEAEQVGG